jgi:hypothetical protein
MCSVWHIHERPKKVRRGLKQIAVRQRLRAMTQQIRPAARGLARRLLLVSVAAILVLVLLPAAIAAQATASI